MWSRQRTNKLKMDQEEFTRAFVVALQNERVVDQLRNSICANLQKEITDLKELVTSKNERIKELEKRVEVLESSSDSLEQYSRRNSLRLYGVEEKDHDNILETSLNLFQTQMNIDIQPIAIDRVHRIGKKTSNGQPRPVLVKFASYRQRELVFKAKSRLKHSQPEGRRVYINEDLTKHRAQLLFEARKLKRERQISDCWTFDGRIIIKNRRGKIETISSPTELRLAAQ